MPQRMEASQTVALVALCLTLTSQYDTDTIFLSAPDTSTVQLTAGQNEYAINIAHKHITRLFFFLLTCTLKTL